jgi:hypothetical protein
VWLQALLAGGPRPPVGVGELETELRDVLTHWHDDRHVAASSLAAFAGAGPERPDAPAVRAVVERAVDRARSGCDPSQELALRAVQRAYLDRAASHERVADELHVSRTTFYRLLHRGTERVARALAAG